MVSQLLFGEMCICLEQNDNWWKVCSTTDQYEGWLNPRMLRKISKEELSQIKKWHYVLGGSVGLTDGTQMRLPIGARLPIFQSKANEISINGKSWKKNTDLVLIEKQASTERTQLIRHFLNTPYLWGGRSGFGIDCSGLTQQVFAMCGILLPRDSSQQALRGESIQPGKQKAGDLAFFSKPNQNRITHVGMLINENEIVHAAGKVRRDAFSEQGIWNHELEILTHQLVSIKRC